MRNKSTILWTVFMIVLFIIAIGTPIILVLNSDYADSTAVMKPVTIKDIWVTEHRRHSGGGVVNGVAIGGHTTTYQVYHVTVTDGEQQFDTTITGQAFKHLNIGDSIYATVHYNNTSNEIMEVIVLSEEQYKHEMERFNNGEIEVLPSE